MPNSQFALKIEIYVASICQIWDVVFAI